MTCLFKIWRTVTGLSLQCSEQETNNNKQKQKHPMDSVIINFKEKKLYTLKSHYHLCTAEHILPTFL